MAKRVSEHQLVGRLNQVVADAVRDHARSSELRLRDFDQGRKLCARIVNGISGRAHGWCVDFKGTADGLVAAGLAHPDWFKDAGVCKGIVFAGRKIELYREDNRGYELSIAYTDSERERA